MTEQHPITPPPELVDLINSQAEADIVLKFLQWAAPILIQRGADQELVACMEWLEAKGRVGYAAQLCSDRRPKPPSLKEQALADLDSMSIEPCLINGIDVNAAVRAKYDNIRRALKQLLY